MRKVLKVALCLILLVPLVLLAVMSVWRWANRPPRKPDTIPLGDYAYTVDYAEFRINQLMKQHDFPSMAVALIDDQDVVWQQAFGLANVEQGIPANTDTVYKLWSVAKAFTAIETMRLVEEGLIDLDAPITDYLPQFSIQSRFADREPVTVRRILTHRSGLPRNGCQRVTYTPGSRNLLARLVSSLEDCRTAFPPGYRYKYSNIGADTLGLIIEELRGESFASYMKSNLMEPVGMDSSAFVSAGIPGGKTVAPGYEYWKGDYYLIEQGDIAGLPHGNLYSTIEDMGGFVRFLFRGGEAGGEQIIKPETLKLMFAQQASSQNDPQPMGLGWKVARVLGSEQLVWHDGGPSDGTGTLVALLPERKLGVVLIANEIGFEGPISVSLATDILELMLETKTGIVPAEDVIPGRADVDRSTLQEYVGKYAAYGQTTEVFLRGNRLKAKLQGVAVDLIPVDQTTFRVSHWLQKLGLIDLFRLPVGLQELEIQFLPGKDDSEDVMIINISGINYEICPKYPGIGETPALWAQLEGEYELVYRTPSGHVGSEVVGRTEIGVDDGVLWMAGWVGPLKPISETEIIILSGSFAGETMVYEPDTGYIYHQSVVYKPARPG